MNQDDHRPIQNVEQTRKIVITGLLVVLIPFCACIGYALSRQATLADPPDGITAQAFGPITVQGERIADPMCDAHGCWATYRVAFLFSDSNGTHIVPLVTFPVKNHVNRLFGQQRQSPIL